MDFTRRLVKRYEIATTFLPDDVEHHRPVSNRTLGVRRGTETTTWKKIRKLGRGTFSDVWLEEEKDGRQRAVKAIDKDERAATNMQHLQELFAMASLAEVRPKAPCTNGF